MKSLPLILASASPRRRRLIADLPWRVKVVPSRVSEPRPPRGADPARWAEKLARKKAISVARRMDECLVLGADTLVFRAGRIFGKPTSTVSARRMLLALSGRWHTVFTGLALAADQGRRVWSSTWATKVRMKTLSPTQLVKWSKRNHDKAGAYAIQEKTWPRARAVSLSDLAKSSPFVEKIRGDFDNVVGLPRRGARFLVRKAALAGYKPILK